LAKIYQNHLDRANLTAKNAGVKINTVLMDGKPYDQILRYIDSEKPSLLILGRTGVHNTNGLDIGSTTENLLRLVPCNVLLTGGNVEAKLEISTKQSEYIESPENKKEYKINTDNRHYSGNILLKPVECNQEFDENSTVKAQNSVVWTKEAQMQTERIPSFIRDVVRARIEDFAKKNGYREITTKIVDEARNNLMANDSLHKIFKK